MALAPDNSKDRPRRNPDNAYRAVGDEGGLVVVPATSEVQVLNPVGTVIYKMLDGKHTRAEIVRAIVDEFDVTEEVAGKDLDDFLADLRSRQLLDEAREQGGAT